MNGPEGGTEASRLKRGAELAKRNWRKIAIPTGLCAIYGAGMLIESKPLDLVADLLRDDKQVSGLVINKGRQAETDTSVKPIICEFNGPCPVDATSFKKPPRRLVLIAQCEDHPKEGGSVTQVCDPNVLYEVDKETYDAAQKGKKVVLPSGSKKVELDINP